MSQLKSATHDMPFWAKLLHKLGKPVAEQFETIQTVFSLFSDLFNCAVKNQWRRHEIYAAIVQIGIGSIPIIVIATTFAGLVITNEMAWHMNEALHTITLMPGFTGQFILRELGIAIPALLLVSKVGAAITAEIGTMKVTDQLDALKLLGIQPVSYLVFPRFIASILSTACLTLIAIIVTLSCALSVAVIRYNFSFLEYLNALRHFVGAGDVFCALVKGSVFGAVIPVISCAYGFRCKGGAEGVGRATTDSVVASTIAIIVLDFVLTYFFTLVLS